MRLSSSSLSVVALLGTATPALSQQLPVGDPLEDYLRVLQVAGRGTPFPPMIRPMSLERAMAWQSIDVEHPWAERYRTDVSGNGHAVRYMVIDPIVRGTWNSDHPVVRNDGPVWLGKGATLEMTGGVTVGAGPVTLTFHPTLFYSENRAFETVDVPVADGISAFGNPWHGGAIDLPQRFGAEAFWDFDLGQSSIRADYGVGSVGVATENMWWGPGIRASIAMTNNAGGFPHAFVSTSRPLSIGIGTIAAKWIWGRLSESEFFDDLQDNDTRFVTGLVFDFQPEPVAGLHVGGSRVFYETLPPEGLPFSEYLLVFQGITKASQSTPDNIRGDDERDQLLSFFVRWLLQPSALEAYAEWARNDHSRDVRDFLVQPGHSEAYTLGLHKVITVAGMRLLRLTGEFTHLELSKTLLDRETPTYYTHHKVRQGYTHRGQVVGAGIGPGGNSQYLGADMFSSWGSAGVFVQRDVHDNDAYYGLRQQGLLEVRRNDVEMTLGATGRFFFPAFDISGTLAVARELNRYYVDRNDVTNLHLQLAVRWRWQ